MTDDETVAVAVAVAATQTTTVAPTLDDVVVPDMADLTGDVHVQFASIDDDDDGDHEESNASRETACSFLTGCAGTGKSYTIRERLREDPSYAVLAATTGVSAVNLNATTIHSLLGFFDTDSLRDAYLNGSAQRKLKRIVGDGYKNIVLDEVSMCSHDTLDLLVRVFDDVNQNLAHGERPIGFICTGDFCQLAPIADRKPGAGAVRSRTKAAVPWAFDAATWPRFEANTTKLTKVWRQSDTRFLAALNYARGGQGAMAADALASAGVKFETCVDMDFDGTTLVGKNDEADRFNQIALDRVKGRLIGLPARRWGKARSEWKNIPDRTVLREGAYVMLLANKYDEGQLQYVNGDCGHVRGIQPSLAPGVPPSIIVELVRNGQEVYVESIVRGVESKEKPDDMVVAVSLAAKDDFGGFLAKPHYRGSVKRYVAGQVEYYPVRLAYASTCHKAQGLSLDRVQIDFRGWMMGGAAMSYIALSRGRTIEGLRVVGMKEVVAAKCKIDERVRKYL